MSFLEEILVTKGLAEVEELSDKILEIGKSVTALKEEVITMMQDRYVNYTCAINDIDHLANKARMISSQIGDVLERIENQVNNDVASSKEKLDELTQALKEATLPFELSNKLLKIHSALDSAQDAQNNSKFFETARELKIVEEDMKGSVSDTDCLDIFESLNSELKFELQKHQHNAVKSWSQCLVWSESTVENSCRIVALTLPPNTDREELFKALYYYDMLSFEMCEFSKKLFKDVLCPIITNVTHVDFEGSSTLGLRIDLSHGGVKPFCINVLNNLTIVFNFLNLQLNINANEDVNFMSQLRHQISDKFCSYFFRNCLSIAVPKKRDDLEAYKAFVEEITAFELLLKEIGFIDDDDKSIAEYTTNIEELFANKTCEAYLLAARNIMKKDLNDISQVGLAENDSEEVLDMTSQPTNLRQYTFQFPSCQISNSTVELLALVSDILQQVHLNTELCAVRLFLTARTVFSMYCDVVPEFHKKLLDTVPQLSAILHNNAMYLAHQLMFLGPKYQPGMSLVLQEQTTTFLDLVDHLRILATSTINKQLQTQKGQINATLKDSGLNGSSQLSEGMEKAVRQCLRQLALLQTVWQDVLPVNTYCKALGLLCNAFVEEIIQKVIATEHLSVDSLAQLVVVFSLIQEKAPQIFPEPLEIHQHVKKWAKLCELQMLLGAGLREVEDRWGDGKGPLAQEYTADQVRHLIRALFHTSDRRAELLAKII